MIENDNDIYLYDYLDDQASDEREKVLQRFINDNSNQKDMEFYDLSFYLKRDSCVKKIESFANRSYFDNKIILSESQIEILSILEEKNLFLSAPTSFGKTFIVLEYMIRHPNLKNIVFIVPTLALMNELLKKIYDHFSDNYNICINGNEKLKEKNIFIFVPERSDCNFINLISDIELDLLIIDEIYKLKPKDKKELNSDDRIILMNKVYLNLLAIAKKIILLGPFIKQITFEQTKLDIVKYYTNLSPVFNYVKNCPETDWIDYMGENNELVYFSSPESIYKSLEKIINKFDEKYEYIEKYKNEIAHLEKIFFKEWIGIKLLRRGIGIHHVKIPMFLRKFYEEEYRNGSLKCLLCTSTLMEGINTPTMKMLVVDNPGNIFKLNNLIGRVGRLNVNNPNAGYIYLFNKKACENYKNKNKWESLTILSENKTVSSDDEILFLNKSINDYDKGTDYKEKVDIIINSSGKRLEEIKNFDIKINTAFKFVKENYKEKFLTANEIKECIRLSYDLLGRISFKFNKKAFSNIDYPIETLPYIVFTSMLINGYTYGKIISFFESKYGELSTNNKNILIDKLLELRTFIKFKLSKINNYFNLFGIDITQNRTLESFVRMLSNFNDLKIQDKILEDLGIEEIDFQKLDNLLQFDDNISTSDVIKLLKSKKDVIETMQLSPFTKRNIKKL